jgi:rhodanese-related sulfurtransferase
VPSTAAVYQKIAASEALRIMEETDGYILLDVRTQEEFEQAHIKGAILLPDTEIKDKAEEQLKDKNAVILVYCRSGRRSAQAAQQLADMGYTKVNDFGGIIDWPYDTVSGTEVK